MLGRPANGGDEGGEGVRGGGGGGGGATAGGGVVGEGGRHGEDGDKLHGSGIGDDDAAAGAVGEEAAGAAVGGATVAAAGRAGEHAIPRLLGSRRCHPATPSHRLSFVHRSLFLSSLLSTTGRPTGLIREAEGAKGDRDHDGKME